MKLRKSLVQQNSPSLPHPTSTVLKVFIAEEKTINPINLNNIILSPVVHYEHLHIVSIYNIKATTDKQR